VQIYDNFEQNEQAAVGHTAPLLLSCFSVHLNQQSTSYHTKSEFVLGYALGHLFLTQFIDITGTQLRH
jgi:hypothetical protein